MQYAVWENIISLSNNVTKYKTYYLNANIKENKECTGISHIWNMLYGIDSNIEQ